MSGERARKLLRGLGGVSRRRIAAAGAGGVLAAAMVAAAAGPAAAAGSPVLAFTPSPFGYGQVTVGQTASQKFTLANSGGKASRALSVRLAGSREFTITADRCTGISLGPRTRCTVTVKFTPARAGTVTAALRAVNNKNTLLASDALTGTGAPAGHIFWANLNTGTIGRANLDGSGVNQNFITGASGPVGVVADASHIYWANFGAGTIGRANLDGSGVNQSFITGASEL